VSNREENIVKNHNGNATPHFHQVRRTIQEFGTVTHLPTLQLPEENRRDICAGLNRVLANSMMLRDLYKKSHWQTSGATFYSLHLLFDKHYAEQLDLIDTLAERIQILGGVSIALAADVAETTTIARPPLGREEPPALISRLLEAHGEVIAQARKLARRAAVLEDDGTNDALVSGLLRTNEMQVWFLSEHLVDVPLVDAD
jgi:starvation-inducible DNA-binding protein